MKRSFYVILLLITSISIGNAQKIDRKALVTRHNIVITNADTLGSLTVGNGKFAFTVDVTGMQSFPAYYKNGVPLGTESEWGWHSNLNIEGYTYDETLQDFDFNKEGRKAAYGVQIRSGRGKAAGDYFRENPHRLQLGNIGLEIRKKDNTLAAAADIKDIHQVLNLWTGEITSKFTVEGDAVTVVTCVDANSDVVSFKITSDLIRTGRLWVKLKFPAPTSQFTDMGVNYNNSPSNKTVAGPLSTGSLSDHGTVYTRSLDETTYYASVTWSSNGGNNLFKDNYYILMPAPTS